MTGTGYTTVSEGITTVISAANTSYTVMMFEMAPKFDGAIYDANFICASLGAKHKVICNEAK